jgi:GTPase SAR1 family protein
MTHFDARLLSGMPRLISLSLADNELRMIPQQIELVSTLERLSVENNKITKVPAAMEKLVNLRMLRLHGNMIRQLPLNLAHLNNLVDFTVAFQKDGYEIQGLDPAIVAAEKQAIESRQSTVAAYAWIKRTVEGSMIINRCKLLLVGEANIGKSACQGFFLSLFAFFFLLTRKRFLSAASTVKSLALFAKGRPAGQQRKPNAVNASLKKNLSVPLNKFRDAVNSALKRTDNESGPHSPTASAGSPLSQSASANATSSPSSLNSSSKNFNSLRGKEAKAAALLSLNNVATDGIEIQTIVLETEDVANSSFSTRGITVSCWDFAGQDVYLTTHQFFLGKRSIYLIGFRLDRPLEDGLSRVEYWLQTIRLRAPNAPIALLGTHLDDYVGVNENLTSLKKSLMERYKKHFAIIDVFFVSNATHEGVHEMVRGLTKLLSDRKQRAKLGIEQQRPVTYMVLAEALTAAAKEMDHPVMSWAEWCKFVQSNAMIQEEADVVAATTFLSDVGALLWFNEPQLRDAVVLDCQWLTSVFASIVTVRSTLIRNGVFRHADLPLLWKHFPSALHPFMLQILRKFELVYSPSPSWIPPVELMRYLFSFLTVPSSLAQLHDLAIAGGDASSPTKGGETSSLSDFMVQIPGGFSIVAPMLPENPPPEESIARFWSSEVEESDITRCYSFKFLPLGFFNRLLVRLLNADWSLRLIWRSAMIAVKEQYSATLYLSYNEETNEVFFTLRGPRSSTQVAPIIDSLNTLMSEWLKEGNVMVYAVIHLSDGTHHKMDVKTLEKYVAKGGVFVTISNERVRLDGVVPELAMAGIVEETALAPADLEIGRELGRGAFATVRLGVYKGQEVAIKQLQLKDDKTSSEMFEEFRREVWLMSRLQHENIVRLLGVSLRPEPSMVMEYMNGGHLFSYLHRSGKKICWEEKMSLAMDVARGMQFIHSTKPPIVHRDLKSPNVLLTHRADKPYPSAKIADFGLSRGLEWSSHYSDKVVDNPTWLAPEVLRKERYNEKVDIYAFGVILYELATQKQFFGEISFFHELEETVLHGTRPPISDEIPSYVRQLIEVCWQEDSHKRPDFNVIVQTLTSQKPVSEVQIEQIQQLQAAAKPALRLNASRGKLINSANSNQTAPTVAATSPKVAPETQTPNAPLDAMMASAKPTASAAASQLPTLTRRRSGRDTILPPNSQLANTSTPSTPEEGRSRNNSVASSNLGESYRSTASSMMDSFRSDDSSSSDESNSTSSQRGRSESISSVNARLRNFSISSAQSISPADPAFEPVSTPSTPEAEQLSVWPPPQFGPSVSANQSSRITSSTTTRKRTNAGAPLPAHLSDIYRRAVQVPDPQTALRVGARDSTDVDKSASFLTNTWKASVSPSPVSNIEQNHDAADSSIAGEEEADLRSRGDSRRNSL